MKKEEKVVEVLREEGYKVSGRCLNRTINS